MSLCFDFTEPGLSTGGIAGIAVAVVAGLLLLVGYFGFYRKKKVEKFRLSTASEDPSSRGILKIFCYFFFHLCLSIDLKNGCLMNMTLEVWNLPDI